MARNTIDYGIDLGTTNSAIACVDPATPPAIIENNYNERITPSAVAITHKGEKRIGKAAIQMFVSHRQEDTSNVMVEFKRRMGTTDPYVFTYGNKKCLPEELSAEVLQEMRSSVERKRGEQINAAVITIPAAFEQPQIAATRRAATLAGFTRCELLQEPVAAALAYGFLESRAQGYWLVYDLGGGTFDAALLRIQEGIIVVSNHCGNNHLGGKDIDNTILDRIIMPNIEAEYGLDRFTRGEKRWISAVQRLRYLTEQAKIELTTSDSTELHIDRIYDLQENDWIDLDYDYELTREDIDPVYEIVLRQTLNHCQDLLKQSRLNSKDIDRVILVGGPTHYPLIRNGLESELGCKLDFRQDPMTVVALGAAVFASTRQNHVAPRTSVDKGTIEIEFAYESSGMEQEPSIGGIVKALPNQRAIDLQIELIHNRTQWRSGKHTLAKNGAFLIVAHAEKGINEFIVELTDSRGNMIRTSPDRALYSMVNLDIQAKSLIHNISISNPDGTPFVIFHKSESFPVKCTVMCQTDHAIAKGSTEDALLIQIYEGNNTKTAKRNYPIGCVRVPAVDFPRDLPAKVDVELRLQLGDEGNWTGTAEVPMFHQDDPYKVQWTFEAYGQNMQNLEQAKESIQDRIEAVRPLESKDSLAAEIMQRIEAENLLEQIDDAFEAARVDKDEATRCRKMVLRVEELCDEIEAKQEKPELEERGRQAIAYLEKLLKSESNQRYHDLYKKILDEYKSAAKETDLYHLRQVIERIDDLIHSILAQHIEWWLDGLQYAESNRSVMSDQHKASRLFTQARRAIDENDMDGLKSAVVQLIRLLPKDIQEQSGDFGNVWGISVNK